jgi:hypothetical protein
MILQAELKTATERQARLTEQEAAWPIKEYLAEKKQHETALDKLKERFKAEEPVEKGKLSLSRVVLSHSTAWKEVLSAFLALPVFQRALKRSPEAGALFAQANAADPEASFVHARLSVKIVETPPA